MGRRSDGSPVTGLVVRLIIVTLALLAIGCSAPRTSSVSATAAPQARSAESYVRTYGGLEGAYRAILAETSCDALQEQMYTATENKTTGFQAAITDRAADLGCPTLRFTRP